MSSGSQIQIFVSTAGLLAAVSVFFSADFARANDFRFVMNTNASAWGDYNNDTYPDMFGDGVLYTNNAVGGFTTSNPYGSTGYISLGDYNNDGWLDVYGFRSGEAGGRSMNLYANNAGTGTFTDMSAAFEPTSEIPWISRGFNLGDFNGDGYMDVYVSGWSNPWLGPPEDDIIYMNNAGDTFTQSWKSSDAAANQYGKGVATLDYNRDGRLDIYVSNYWRTPNYLWRNDGFNGATGLTSVGGVVADAGHTQGSAVGDFNNDGNFDIYVSNFAHSGNSPLKFLENQGPDSYSFTSRGQGGITQLEPFSSAATADFDNDGYLDLFITTSGGYAQSGQTKLYRNNGNWTFDQVDYGLNNLGTGDKAAWADYDNDGFLDLIGAGRLWKNPGKANWPQNDFLKVKLIGGKGSNGLVNTSAIGAQVTIDVPGLGKISRQVEAATGQMGMVNDLTLHFGLGNYSDSTVDLEIFWPDGSVQFVTGAAKNQLVEIRIPEPATLGTLVLGGSALLRRRRK